MSVLSADRERGVQNDSWKREGANAGLAALSIQAIFVRFVRNTEVDAEAMKETHDPFLPALGVPRHIDGSAERGERAKGPALGLREKA